MKFIEYTKKLDTIRYLCEHKRAGTPRQLGRKLNVSERTIKRMVQHLRDLGFPIKFDRSRKSYVLEESIKGDIF
jgi:predicted DNA-binding transcriptional regulator YafY